MKAKVLVVEKPVAELEPEKPVTEQISLRLTWEDAIRIIEGIGIVSVLLGFSWLVLSATNTTPKWAENMYDAIGKYVPYLVLGVVMVLIIKSFREGGTK